MDHVSPAADPSWLQTLTSISNDAVSALDRENSHFEVAEGIIEALEQLRATKDESESDDEDLPSDHIRDYAFSLTTPALSTTTNCSPLSPAIVRKSISPNNDTNNGTSDKNISPDFSDWVSVVGTSIPSISSPLNNDSISTVLEKFAHNQSIAKNGPQSVARQLFNSYCNFSAEESAELEWLVSDKGKNAALPRSHSDLSLPLRLRGTQDWAPPRAQIIYHLHPPATRKSILMRCGYRCAGCGMKIDLALASVFRYCAYLGKYFCHSCHHEKIAYIPARLLHKWDFRKQRVSNFAYDLLEKMYAEPLYCIADTNYNLYKSISDMRYARALRYQLYFLNEYLRSCRNGVDLLEHAALRPHLISEPQLYSLQDLTEVKDTTLLANMRMLVTTWLQHVDNCGLCKVKGFICELCEREDIIYPFQLDSVIQCQMCWACYHKQCYTGTCPKCARMRARKSVSQTKVSESAK